MRQTRWLNLLVGMTRINDPAKPVSIDCAEAFGTENLLTGDCQINDDYHQPPPAVPDNPQAIVGAGHNHIKYPS